MPYTPPPKYEILERLRWANTPIPLIALFNGSRPRWAWDALDTCLAEGLVERHVVDATVFWSLTARGLHLTHPWANREFPGRPEYHDNPFVPRPKFAPQLIPALAVA